MDEILIFEWMKHRWLIFKFDLLCVIEWKPFVKMKLSEEFSFGRKMWEHPGHHVIPLILLNATELQQLLSASKFLFIVKFKFFVSMLTY